MSHETTQILFVGIVVALVILSVIPTKGSMTYGMGRLAPLTKMPDRGGRFRRGATSDAVSTGPASSTGMAQVDEADVGSR